MKKLVYCFLFCAVFYFIPVLNGARAATTAYQTPSTYLKDGVAGSLPFIWTASTTEMLEAYGTSFSFPTGREVIDGIRYKFTINASTSGWSFFPSISNDDGTSYFSQASGTCGLGNGSMGIPCQYNTISGTTTNGVIGQENTNATHTFTAAELTGSHMRYKWRQSASTKNINISAFQVAVDYHIPEPSFTINNVATTSSTISFNITGNTTITGALTKCDIALYEKDITTNSLLTSAFATIHLDSALPRQDTQNLGAGSYLGYGFTDTISTWSASNISGPFFSGINVEIVGYQVCSHQTQNPDGSLSDPITDLRDQSLSISNTNWNDTLIATPSALQNTPPPYEGDCSATDWVCSFQHWLYNNLQTIFGVNSQFAETQFAETKALSDSKVPFAYINSMLHLDFSPTYGSTSAPSFVIPIVHSNAYVSDKIPTSMTWTDTGSGGIIGSLTGSIRIIFQIGLWLSFIFYLFTLVHHV